MKNSNHSMEDIFRQRLHDAEMPPPPFVWPAVEHELRKRRRLWILWLFAFGFVAASVVLWFSNPLGDVNTRAVTAPSANIQTDEPKETHLSQEVNAKSNGEKSDFEKPGTIRSNKSDFGPQSQKDLRRKPSAIQVQSSNSNQTESTPTPGLIDFAILTTREPAPLITTQALQITQTKQISSISQQKKGTSTKLFKPHSRRKKAEPKVCYDFARHPSAWLIDVYAGPSLAQSSMTSRLDDEPYLNQRLATEQRSVAMNAGLRVSLMFNRNFLVRTGLHYDQVTEVFEFIDPTSVTYILRYNNGDPTPDTLGVQYGANYLKTYNRYGMLDIPLMMGVEMRRGRSGFSINAGISANVLFQKRGVIIDPVTHEPARFGSTPDKPKNIGPNARLSQEVFRPNVGLSATASIQWYWHLNTRLRLFVEPSFRQVLRPVSVDSHPVEQRYSILGLRLGATKIF